MCGKGAISGQLIIVSHKLLHRMQTKKTVDFSQVFSTNLTRLAGFWKLIANCEWQQVNNIFEVSRSSWNYFTWINNLKILPQFSAEVLKLSWYLTTPRHLWTRNRLTVSASMMQEVRLAGVKWLAAALPFFVKKLSHGQSFSVFYAFCSSTILLHKLFKFREVTSWSIARIHLNHNWRFMLADESYWNKQEDFVRFWSTYVNSSWFSFQVGSPL